MEPDQVYFDPRKIKQQEEEDQQQLIDEQKAKEDEEKAYYEIGKAVGMGIVFFAIGPLAFMLLWNWIMPGLFGLATIGYLKSFGLLLMSRILFGNNNG